MAIRIHILTRTAKAEVLARRELGNFGFTLEVEQNDPGQIDPALRRLGLDQNQAAVLSTPNLILATNTPTELAEFLTWVKNHPPVVLEERPAPLEDANTQTIQAEAPASNTGIASLASLASDDSNASQDGRESRKPPQTRQDLAKSLAELANAKIEAHAAAHRRSTQHKRQGEYNREYSS